MKLSIITINYNNKAGLEKTIASVMTQTFRDFEWILVDGGSNDGSAELIEELAKEPEANITYWCSEPDKGIYNAMNKGIAHSHGEYINFMNSGDCFYDNKTLSEMFPYVESHVADIYYGDALCIYADREDLVLKPKHLKFDSVFSGCLCHQASFIKRQLLIDSNGYDEKLKIVSDWKMWLVWMMQNKKFIHVGKCLCRTDTTGVSLNNIDLRELEKQHVFAEILPSGLAEDMYRLKNYDRLFDGNQILFQYIASHNRFRKIVVCLMKIITFIRG